MTPPTRQQRAGRRFVRVAAPTFAIGFLIGAGLRPGTGVMALVAGSLLVLLFLTPEEDAE